MADSDLGRVDFGLEADLTAMTASGDFHRQFLLDDTRPMPGAFPVKIPSLGISSNGG